MIIEKYAEIIVDVPTHQTNRPYTYRISPALIEQVVAGMRVIVPFGKRKVQGFVLKITQEKPKLQQIKSIISIQDVQPVLNQEMLALSNWLSQYTFAFQISCLQIMLPNVLRASYHKALRLLVPFDEVDADIQAFLGDNQQVLLEREKIAPPLWKKLEKLLQYNQAEVVYLVKDKANVKLQKVIKPCLTVAQYQDLLTKLPSNATKQKKLLTCLLQLATCKEQGLQKDLITEYDLDSQAFKQGKAKKWLAISEIEQYRAPYQALTNVSQPLTLNAEQQDAFEQITQKITSNQAQTFLLQGVTGSGKTEVYLQCMAQALKQNKTALMLVPEISLTPQMVKRVKSRFGQQVAVLHSGLSDGEKYDEWRRIKRQEAKVVVGARSAVFAPLENLGLIIMDEEHESSYKQEEMPRYHARDVALWRANYHQCPLVLGSATPCLETRARAQKNVYQRLCLTKRANQQALPEVTLIDMRQQLGDNLDFSPELLAALKERIRRAEQAVLLLNRRGYASFALCRECGFVARCPNCDISLTYHLTGNILKCHYCGYEQPKLTTCPSCQGHKINYLGTGTQKVEEKLQTLLPEARIIRMDVDTTRKKGAHERLLNEFGAKKADILLGTQMIAKGLDFPDVTLVGVLNADTALMLPDFRASERTFQLLTQVSGRAGRATKKGEVIIQTYNPKHYAISLVTKQDYERFYSLEMNMRHLGGYPPYYYTIQITASSLQESQAARAIYLIKRELQQILTPQSKILGPTPKPITRVNKRYYYQMVIKFKNEPHLKEYLQELLIKSQTQQREGVRLIIDRDPLNFI